MCDITPQYLFLMGIVTGGHFVPLVMNVNPLVVFIALIFGFLHLTLFVVELISFFAKREDVLPLPPTL